MKAWGSRRKCCYSWVLMSARMLSVEVGGVLWQAKTQQTHVARSLDREHALVVGHSKADSVAEVLR